MMIFTINTYYINILTIIYIWPIWNIILHLNIQRKKQLEIYWNINNGY